jgi:hypothetical protein
MTDTRPLEVRIREYLNTNSTAMDTVEALLNSGRIPPGGHRAALRASIDTFRHTADDIRKLLDGEELTITIREIEL